MLKEVGIVISVVLLSAAFALAGCSHSSSASNTAGSTSNETQTVTISTNFTEATIELPTEWSVEKDSDSNYYLAYPNDFDGLVEVGMTLSPLSSFADDSAVLSYINALDTSISDVWVQIDSDTTPTYQTDVQFEGGKEGKGYARVIISGDECIEVLALAAGSDWDAAKSELQQIISTFTVTNPQAPRYSGTVVLEGSGASESASSTSDATSNETSASNATSASTSSTTISVQKYSAGSYRVGTDIAAGEYKFTCSGSHAYYCVYPDTTKSKILSNGNFTTCTYVTVSDGQLLEVKGSTFVAVADAEPTSVLSGYGIYKVGLDIAVGEYNLTATSDMGYYAILSTVDANVNHNIVGNDNFEGNSFVSVSDGQYLEISRASIGQ